MLIKKNLPNMTVALNYWLNGYLHASFSPLVCDWIHLHCWRGHLYEASSNNWFWICLAGLFEIFLEKCNEASTTFITDTISVWHSESITRTQRVFSILTTNTNIVIGYRPLSKNRPRFSSSLVCALCFCSVLVYFG